MVNIGIDFDGVIIDSSNIKIRIAKERFGIRLTPERASKENILLSGVSVDDYNIFFRTILSSQEKFLINLVPGAKEVMNQLYLSNGIYVITSRHNDDLKHIKDLLRHHDINYHFIINTSDQPKNKACLENKIAIYLDDDVHKLQKINNGFTKCFLLDKPYNRNIDFDKDKIERVLDWHDFYSRIKRLL